MDRETNRNIISYRSELKGLYHKWNHEKKSGVEHLPREASEQDVLRVGSLLAEESLKLRAIRECCDEFIKEIEGLDIVKKQKDLNIQ